MVNKNKNQKIDDLELVSPLSDDDQAVQNQSGADEIKEDPAAVVQDSAAPEPQEGGSVNIAKTKVVLLKKLLNNIKENNDRLSLLVSSWLTSEEEAAIKIGQLSDDNFSPEGAEASVGRIIEGVFDGENMIGPDGKQYSVPANYASKSKLVEGDILKLTITANGTFIYKQIGPIERSRIVASLERTKEGSFIAQADGRKWLLLTASVTYYKGESGDEVVVLIPKTGESKWAAVENIVKKRQ